MSIRLIKHEAVRGCGSYAQAVSRSAGKAGSHSRCERDVLADEGSRVTVWIYVDSRKQVGDKDHLKVFADQDAAREWFGEHDREGVAFEYSVRE
jgi:hypothetical protein